MSRPTKPKLYTKTVPTTNFNQCVISWLEGHVQYDGRATPKAFDPMLAAFRTSYPDTGCGLTDARARLNGLSAFFKSFDLSPHLVQAQDASTGSGFRTSHSQSVVKNIGENFMNFAVWTLAQAFRDRDDIIVDKGVPQPLRQGLTVERSTFGKENVEVDFAVYSRADPTQAILWNAKTRLRDVYKNEKCSANLLADIADPYIAAKRGYRQKQEMDVSKIDYVFITADSPDELNGDRFGNNHRVTASYFAYNFVTKPATLVNHAQTTLGSTFVDKFHTADCMIDLIQAKFG